MAIVLLSFNTIGVVYDSLDWCLGSVCFAIAVHSCGSSRVRHDLVRFEAVHRGCAVRFPALWLLDVHLELRTELPHLPWVDNFCISTHHVHLLVVLLNELVLLDVRQVPRGSKLANTILFLLVWHSIDVGIDGQLVSGGLGSADVVPGQQRILLSDHFARHSI